MAMVKRLSGLALLLLSPFVSHLYQVAGEWLGWREQSQDVVAVLAWFVIVGVALALLLDLKP